MTNQILARYHRATETVEAVNYGHIFQGGYRYGVRFIGGKHDGMEIRCHTVESLMRMFNEAVAARKSNQPLWWLDGKVA